MPRFNKSIVHGGVVEWWRRHHGCVDGLGRQVRRVGKGLSYAVSTREPFRTVKVAIYECGKREPRMSGKDRQMHLFRNRAIIRSMPLAGNLFSSSDDVVLRLGPSAISPMSSIPQPVVWRVSWVSFRIYVVLRNGGRGELGKGRASIAGPLGEFAVEQGLEFAYVFPQHRPQITQGRPNIYIYGGSFDAPIRDQRHAHGVQILEGSLGISATASVFASYPKKLDSDAFAISDLR